MCLLRIALPNLCQNINHFDAVDFSECHSEVSFDAQCMYILYAQSILKTGLLTYLNFMHTFLSKVPDNLKACLKFAYIATTKVLCKLDSKYCRVFTSYKVT